MADATLRFYGNLNDFLPRERRRVAFVHTFAPPVSVKDLVESLGVPHPEIELLLVNGCSVDFLHRVRSGDRVTVYPAFRSLDVSPVSLVRRSSLNDARFVLDTHLGRLAAYLRLAGFECVYGHGWDDEQLAQTSSREHRMLLTRDAALLKRSIVEYGCWVRAIDPHAQLAEISSRLDLSPRARPFSRCLRCNEPIEPVAKSAIIDRLPRRTRECYDEFWRCAGCGRVYWKGGHYGRLRALVEGVMGK